ncbi:cyclopropane-fatty-acyl-phospholipid synthase family protein [Nocardiopsis sp. SBT366]|uniref:SAM-dependent methyltransferase n=1 Tax=Nocardiopsis sp. SBT366 TaxID=1580529 RepID=UPI00066CCE81|nr:methyltransferase domain-containing protein [Nocardiopsis sp. SBT366]
MTTPEVPPLYRDVDFNGPLNDERAVRLIRSLGPLTDRHVVDVGCGWAELLLRTLATEPTATGFGIDLSEDYVRLGRANAKERGLADRVELVAGNVGAWRGEPADVMLNIGASHVWGGDPVVHTANALAALADLTRPGGRAAFAECFWKRPPTDAEMAAMPFIPRDQYRSMPELVDFALSHGFRLIALAETTVDEWDEFENWHCLGWEDWLRENPDSPDFDEVRDRADRHRHARVHAQRETQGFAYLTLLRV